MPQHTTVAACLVGIITVTVHGHGGMTIPPPRNNYGNIAPTNLSYQPGSLVPNWQGGSCAGDMCLWFNEGCFIGCPNCSSATPTGVPSGAIADRYVKPYCTKPMEPTLPEEFRSWNRGNPSVYGDWTRYHPWRAPGYAPVEDPCGMAGGTKLYNPVGGETPNGAKQFDRGSKLPKLDVVTEWIAGGVAEVGWMVGSNHGGGYVYSLCPANETLSETCFQKMTLPFVGNHHIIRHMDNMSQYVIPAAQVSEGTFPVGSTWRRNPIPACNCDAGKDCGMNKTTSKLPHHAYYSSYSNGTQPLPEGAEACPTGTQFTVPFPYGYGQDMFDHMSAYMWAIVDQVEVPKTTGEYVLRWRWDTEQTPQIWTHCADVTVVGGV